MIKVVIFDFDDTLCLTEEGCFILENEIAIQMGHKPMTREVHKKTWGQELGKVVQERIPGIDGKEFMRQIAIWQPIFAQEGKVDVVTQENLEVLDTLTSHGKRLAVLTSRELQEVRHLLHEEYPLTSRVEAFYHKDNSDYTKPDPRVFDKILAKFAVSPDEAVYIGDAVTDGIAAKTRGLHFIALMESGIREKEEFAQISVDLFANKLSDILPYILNA